MKEKLAIAAGAAILAGGFLFFSHASASSAPAEPSSTTEEYDVKAFGPKNPIVWNTPVKVTFDHKIHTDDFELECDSCHGDVFAMQRGLAPKTGKFTMAAMAEGQFCGACHDGDTAFATDTNCSACHILPKDPIMWIKPVKAVIFSHNAHINDYEMECDSCHSDVFSMQTGAAEKSPNFTMKALYAGQYCGSCHDGDTAFASNKRCNKCHIGEKGYNRMIGADPHAKGHTNKHGSGH